MKILTNLNQRNKDIWAKSPFVKHSTQTAFKVNTETNLWYCFETQQGGNLTDFVKALSNVEFESAWQPIETMPKDGKVVLGYYLPRCWVCEMSFAPEENKIYAGIDTEFKYVNVDNFSHWMPMPSDPIN